MADMMALGDEGGDENDAVAFVVDAMLHRSDTLPVNPLPSDGRAGKSRWSFLGLDSDHLPASSTFGSEDGDYLSDSNEQTLTTNDGTCSADTLNLRPKEGDAPALGRVVIDKLHTTWSKVSSRFRGAVDTQQEVVDDDATDTHSSLHDPTLKNHALRNDTIMNRFRNMQARYFDEANIHHACATTTSTTTNGKSIGASKSRSTRRKRNDLAA